MPTVPLPVLPGPSAADCCAPRVGLDHVAIVAKALSEPLQVQVLDVLRRSREPELVDAGLVRVERRHKWAYYSVVPRCRAGAFDMAELTDLTPTSGEQPSCCGPSGCAPSTGDDVREAVRARYAAAAVATTNPTEAAGCCGPDGAVITDEQAELFGSGLYGAERDELPDTALLASLGCGNPTAMAALEPGDVVLDLGSGGGIDVLISARRVAPTGTAYGLDMTDEMLDLARANQAKAGVENVHWLKGHIEAIPLPADTVDVVLSNCVINLSTDKPQVLREAARVLKPGGRFAVSDVIADPDMDDATRADMAAYTGCIAGALTEDEYRSGLAAAGFEQVEVQVTHRVHEHASSAIIRARVPA